MPLNFPNSPIIGDEYLTPNGTQYIWDGDKWVSQIGQAAILEFTSEPPVVITEGVDAYHFTIDLTRLGDA